MMFSRRRAISFVCAVFLLAARADAVTITDFGSNTAPFGGDWEWNSGTKTLSLIGSNISTDFLFQTSGVLADITGGQTASITGNLVVPGSGTADFILQLKNSGTTIATSPFSFSQFAAGPQTVTSPLTFTGGSSSGIVNQWYIVGNGNPTNYFGQVAFTSMVVTVPEPSTWAMGLGVLAWGGYSVWRGKRRQRLDRAA